MKAQGWDPDPFHLLRVGAVGEGSRPRAPGPSTRTWPISLSRRLPPRTLCVDLSGATEAAELAVQTGVWPGWVLRRGFLLPPGAAGHSPLC